MAHAAAAISALVRRWRVCADLSRRASRRKAEVDDAHVHSLIEQDVLRLDVAVDHVLLVQVADGAHHLDEELARLVFAQTAVPNDVLRTADGG